MILEKTRHGYSNIIVHNILIFLMFLLTSCVETPTSDQLSNSHISTASTSSTLQLNKTIPVTPQQAETAAQIIALIIADDINRNENHRFEIYSKLSTQFDGSHHMLLSHLNGATISELDNLCRKKGIDRTISELIHEIPRLQFSMRYMDLWSDDQISKKGGVLVAWYPYGEKLRNFDALPAFDKNGNHQMIRKDEASSVPFIIINVSNRVDVDGYLTCWSQAIDKKFANLFKAKSLKSVYNDNPKTVVISKSSDWKLKKISSLSSKLNNSVKQGVNNGSNILLKSQSYKPVIPIIQIDTSEDGGGGGSDPPATPYHWCPSKLKLGAEYDAHWENEVEIRIDVYYSGMWHGQGEFSLANIADEQDISFRPAFYSFAANSANDEGSNYMWIDIWEADTFSDDHVGESFTSLEYYTGSYLWQSFSNAGITYPYRSGTQWNSTDKAIIRYAYTMRYLIMNLATW